MQDTDSKFAFAAPIRHIAWDWNGTLFDDAALCLDVFNNMLQRRGLPALTMARYLHTFGFPVENFYRAAGVDLARESFAEVGTEFILEYERRRLESGLHPHATELLDAIYRAGIRQSVLSAYKHETLETLLAHFGVRHYFDDVIGNDDHYAAGKLDKGRAWAASTGYAPKEILMIGDTEHDYEVARAMGAQCALVAAGNQHRDRLGACGVPVFESLRELHAAMEKCLMANG